MAFADGFPDGTNWSVAPLDQDPIGPFDPNPWTFQEWNFSVPGKWSGFYSLVDGSDNRLQCRIFLPEPPINFELVFVTRDCFVAIKDGKPFRFGKLL